jgi:hypothetical protein
MKLSLAPSRDAMNDATTRSTQVEIMMFVPATSAFTRHDVSARPPKQPRMVRTFFKVHTRPRLTYALRCRGY